MATNRYTFRALVTNVGVAAGGDHISKCNSLLSNRMQCDKAGAYWVEDAENPTKPAYQVCKAHALILESEGKNWVAPIPEETKDEAKPVSPVANSIASLAAKINAAQTVPPVDKK